MVFPGDDSWSEVMAFVGVAAHAGGKVPLPPSGKVTVEVSGPRIRKIICVRHLWNPHIPPPKVFQKLSTGLPTDYWFIPNLLF